MEKQLKNFGTVCIVIALLYAVWGMIGMAYTVPEEAHQYRFDGVYAPEGTVLAVKEGQLKLIGGSNFSVDQPFRRVVDLILGGLCFLTTGISGAIILRLTKKKQVVVVGTEKNEEIESISN